MSDELIPMAFRLPASLVERIDAHAKRLENERPGHRVTRSDTIRVLLELALRQVEPAAKRRK